jgi:hypothetical protein
VRNEWTPGIALAFFAILSDASIVNLALVRMQGALGINLAGLP